MCGFGRKDVNLIALSLPGTEPPRPPVFTHFDLPSFLYSKLFQLSYIIDLKFLTFCKFSFLPLQFLCCSCHSMLVFYYRFH